MSYGFPGLQRVPLLIPSMHPYVDHMVLQLNGPSNRCVSEYLSVSVQGGAAQKTQTEEKGWEGEQGHSPSETGLQNLEGELPGWVEVVS